MYDVICIGSATVDAFIKTEHEKDIISENKTFMAYQLGSKIIVEDLKFTIGGGGTNTAVALARLKNKTAYLGTLGNDQNADLIINNLKTEKIDFLGYKIPTQTDFSVVLDSIKKDRTILNFKNSSKELDYKKIIKSKLKAKWFYISSLTGKSLETLKQLCTYASKNKIKVLFNPSNYIAELGAEKLKKIISNTTILICNLDEAKLLLNTTSNNIKTIQKRLINKGPSTVVITDADNGAYVYDKDTKKYYHATPNKVKVIETTGAGDSFASSFLSGMVERNNIDYSLKLALINAESVISHHGAKEKLLTKTEMDKILKTRKFIINME